MALQRAALLLALLLGLLSLPGRARAELRAGFGREPLPAPEGGPLGGYGGLFERRAEGLLDAPDARALVVSDGHQRVALVALDVSIVTRALRAPLVDALADLELDLLALVATHTHSGPAGYVEGWLAGRVTGGSYDPAVLQGLARAAERAVRAAVDDLAPARASASQGELELAVNRRFEDGPSERALPVLALERGNALPPIALFAYGAHPTVLARASRDYSADWVGAARARLEEGGWRALFVPGPLGDQRPDSQRGPLWPDDLEEQRAQVREVGARVAAAVEAALAAATPAEHAPLRAVEREVAAPEVRVRGFCPLWWFSPLVSGALHRFVSERALFQALQVGAAHLALLPAEPSAALGAQLRARAGGAVPLFAVAHANDWLGYAVEPATWQRGGYEACLSLHGPELGPWLVDEALATLQLLDSRATPGERRTP